MARRSKRKRKIRANGCMPTSGKRRKTDDHSQQPNQNKQNISDEDVPESIENSSTSMNDKIESSEARKEVSLSDCEVQEDEEFKNISATEEGKVKNIVENKRLWWFTDYGARHQQRPQNGIDFTIMTYNILSQNLLEDNRFLYRHCRPKHLTWDYRVRNLLQEISAYDPDIICLQELEEEEFHELIKPHFRKYGYSSLFKRKTREKVDGCAILIKNKKFKFETYAEVEYLDSRIKILDRDNVGLVTLLRPNSKAAGHAKLCVATTHLLFNPKRGDVRLSQLRMLLAEIERLALSSSGSGSNTYYPIILCGDLNSEPFYPLYNFIVNGKIEYNNMMSGDVCGPRKSGSGKLMTTNELSLLNIGINADSKYGSGSAFPAAAAYPGQNISTGQRNIQSCFSMPSRGNVPPHLVNPQFYPAVNAFHPHDVPGTSQNHPRQDNRTFYHHFNFTSAYKHIRSDGAKEITTRNEDSKCTVDYIFYTENFKSSGRHQHQNNLGQLKHIGCYGLLHSSDFKAIRCMPNAYLSSDHLCLISRFLLTA